MSIEGDAFQISSNQFFFFLVISNFFPKIKKKKPTFFPSCIFP